jgi:hypothetical protein
MTNSHDTTIDLPLLLVGMQPTSGSNDDILTAFEALFLGPYLSIHLPLHRDALRAISASPGALQGLAGQLYYALIMLLVAP